MISMRIVASFMALILLAGCATSYKSASTGGYGYGEIKGPGELIRVSYAGGYFTKRKEVETYLLYRCAEIAKRENKTYFALYKNLLDAVMDKRSSGKEASANISGVYGADAYIMLFESPGPGLLGTNELLVRLEPEINREAPK